MFEIKPILHALIRAKAGALMLLIQIAITVAIVSNAGFIINDRIQYLQQETGYPEDQIFKFTMNNFGSDFNFSQQVQLDEERLRAMPGVVNAAYMSEIPLSGSGSASSFYLVPEPTPTSIGVRAAYAAGDENVIDTLGVTIIQGRQFTIDDVVVQVNPDEVPSVIIVSKAFAEEMFPDTNALGQTVFFGPYPMQIVGIVDKMMGPWLKDSRPDNLILLPFIGEQNFQKMIVRTEAGQRDAVMRQIEETMLASYDKRVVTAIEGMDESKRNYNSSDILMMRMLLTLITVLVLVTALGIFGLTLFNINKRTKQIGTRRALGARKSAIVRYFLVENSLICSAGLLIGSVAAVYLGRALLEHYSLPELNTTYVLATAFFVFLVSVLSVLIPANRAANISPSIATRSV